jgi:hypothetical protein
MSARRTSARQALTGPLARTLPATAWGVSAPWTLLASAAIGIWLMFAPSVLGAPAAQWHDLLTGALVILLSFPRGPVRERYGGWQRYVV